MEVAINLIWCKVIKILIKFLNAFSPLHIN